MHTSPLLTLAALLFTPSTLAVPVAYNDAKWHNTSTFTQFAPAPESPAVPAIPATPGPSVPAPAPAPPAPAPAPPSTDLIPASPAVPTSPLLPPVPATPSPSDTHPSATHACAPRINEASLALLIRKEGRMPNIYADQLGAPTIGVGHRCIESACAEVSAQFAVPLSGADMEALLRQDLARFEQSVSASLRDVRLNANQYGVVVSVAFNGGERAPQLLEFYEHVKGAAPGGFAGVFAQHLLGHDLGVADVAERRTEEFALFKTATKEGALPC